MKCENCQSNKIKPSFRVWIVLLITAGCLVWIPILGWVGAPLLLLLVFPVYMAERGKRAVQCNECSNRFMVPKQEFRDWQSSIHK